MKTATIEIRGIGQLCQSRFHATEKLEKEQPDDYEKRTWRNRLHVTKDGRVFIPAMALKFALVAASKFMGEKIKGRGQSTYTKRFTSGILISDDIVTDIKAEDAEGKWLHMNADGVRGSGKRVFRCIPAIDGWRATVTAYVLDDLITEEVFERYLAECGKFIGVGQFRPEVGGNCGRFDIESVTWE